MRHTHILTLRDSPSVKRSSILINLQDTIMLSGPRCFYRGHYSAFILLHNFQCSNSFTNYLSINPNLGGPHNWIRTNFLSRYVCYR
nr:MAG TPA: hypothetical protein [Caudoviricetes sp.]